MATLPALGVLGGLGLPELTIILAIGFLCLVGTGLWIWMLIDCATKEADTGNTKTAWVLIIAITHFVGAMLYMLVRRPQRMAELGR